MLDNEMLITSVEVFFYTQNIKLGLIFTFDFYSTNVGLIQSRKLVDIVMPEQYDMIFINPWFKLFLAVGFTLSLIFYIVRFSLLIRRKIRFIFVDCDLQSFYPSDFVSLIQIVVALLMLFIGFQLFSYQ